MNDIVARLFRDYYESDLTPEGKTSSHWKDLHRKADVQMNSGSSHEFNRIEGSGFGAHPTNVIDRGFDRATIYTYLLQSKSLIPVGLLERAKTLSRSLGWEFCYDDFRQACSLALVQHHKSNATRTDSVGRCLVRRLPAIIIGDGYGFLSGLVHKEEKRQVVLVDLGKTLLFQAHNLTRAFADSHHTLVGENGFDPQADFIYCPAERLDQISGLTIELAFNIASMQEMNGQSVDEYFEFFRKVLIEDNLFYCCNREEKFMPGGEVSSFYGYPWKDDDVHLVEGECPWHRYFLSRKRTKRGVNCGPLRVPFVNKFDGIHLHRLSKLRTCG